MAKIEDMDSTEYRSKGYHRFYWEYDTNFLGFGWVIRDSHNQNLVRQDIVVAWRMNERQAREIAYLLNGERQEAKELMAKPD